MEDKELVEVWRKEFEETIDCKEYIKRLPSGTYSWEPTEFMWAGFQRAKRSNPSVALPIVVPIQDGFSGKLKPYFRKQDVIATLTAAGIKYIVKE